MSDWFSLTKHRAVTDLRNCLIFTPYRHKKRRHRPQLCVNMWERTWCFLLQSRVDSCRTVIQTCQNWSWWSCLVQPQWPTRSSGSPCSSQATPGTEWHQMALSSGPHKELRGWKIGTGEIKAAAKSKEELLFRFFFNLQSVKRCKRHILHDNFLFHLSLVVSPVDISPQYSHIMSNAGSVPSHLGIRPLHITLPSSRWHVMVSAPCVLIKPSSHTTEMELPSWKLSPKRLALRGMPGSGHSLRPNACNKKKTEHDLVNPSPAWMRNWLFEEHRDKWNWCGYLEEKGKNKPQWGLVCIPGSDNRLCL